MRCAFLALCLIAQPTLAEMPKAVGDCDSTTITKITSYFPDIPLGQAGAILTFANGLEIVGQHDDQEALLNRKGDKVTLCLEYIPSDCPPGDGRGKVYRVINKSADRSFSIISGPHMCGGA